MAERRMFTKKVTDDDNFMALSSSAQALYLHLSMAADDDGFCNQVSVSMFKAHASVQDLQALLEKRYIYQFENGVIVIKHWRMANALRKDRYTPTAFKEELARLKLKDNGSYTWLPDGCQVVATCLPQDRLGKDRLEENNNIISSNEDICPSEPKDDKPQRVLQDIVDEWNQLEAYGIKPIRYILAESTRHKLIRTRLKQHGRESFDEVIERIKTSRFLQGKTVKPFMIDFDWVIKPDNYQKTLDGKYNRDEDKIQHTNNSKPDYGDWQT